jgi:serine/threonine protein kinase
LEDGRPTKESDYYGLGMVIYEVLSGQRPFTTGRNSSLWEDSEWGERPERPQGERGKLFTDEIWGILELCWKHQPHDRISASAVLLRLERHPPLSWPPLTLNVDGDAETGSDVSVVSLSQRFVTCIKRLPSARVTAVPPELRSRKITRSARLDDRDMSA